MNSGCFENPKGRRGELGEIESRAMVIVLIESAEAVGRYARTASIWGMKNTTSRWANL